MTWKKDNISDGRALLKFSFNQCKKKKTFVQFIQFYYYITASFFLSQKKTKNVGSLAGMDQPFSDVRPLRRVS